jgi:IclR family KDG regulon transcriptional repressor
MNNSVLKGLSVLELLEDADRSMTLAEISRKAEIPKSTALGILRALVRKRFVEVEEGTRYRLGLRVFVVGELGITAHFAILDGVDVVYLEKEDPAHANVLLASAVGTRLAAHHTAVGQAHLAAFSEEDLVRTLGPGPFGYLDGRASWTLDELKDRLAKVRERGYAMDNEETLENVQCVAAPVLDATGSCRGAVGVSFLKTRFGLQIEDVATPVMAAAGRASERLGHRAKYTEERV